MSSREDDVTIRRVASLAGVSPSTVSRVFSRPDVVAHPTRQRVMDAAHRLGYTPNPVARSLARGCTGNLGIVVPDIGNAFQALTVKAVQARARQEGYALFVADCDDQVQDEERIVRAMVPRVDGLLLAYPLMPDETLAEVAALTPVVVMNRELAGVPSVLIDTTSGARQAVEHLHALGHREVVYLAGPDGYSNTCRLRGFHETTRRLGMIAAVLGPLEPRVSAGVRAADLVLAGSATAVLTYNDEVAVGVVNRLADRGLRVPGDVSVVGFDGAALAELATPRLTTVRLPTRAAGVAGVRLLLDVIRGADSKRHAPAGLAGELIVQASTGPAPNRGHRGKDER
jgi:DNA-binding LacI/PurR family transcriptional regulator